MILLDRISLLVCKVGVESLLSAYVVARESSSIVVISCEGLQPRDSFRS